MTWNSYESNAIFFLIRQWLNDTDDWPQACTPIISLKTRRVQAGDHAVKVQRIVAVQHVTEKHGQFVECDGFFADHKNRRSTHHPNTIANKFGLGGAIERGVDHPISE